MRRTCTNCTLLGSERNWLYGYKRVQLLGFKHWCCVLSIIIDSELNLIKFKIEQTKQNFQNLIHYDIIQAKKAFKLYSSHQREITI